MKPTVSLKCTCGKLRGVASQIPESKAKRMVCLCDDCQAYAHYLGRAPEILDTNGGTDIFPVAPANLKINQGIENLKCVRLSNTGMYRWYAGCCKTPIANTMASPKIPHAGTFHLIMDHTNDHTSRDEALGPIVARVQGKYGIGKLVPGTHQTASLGVVLKILPFLLRGLMKGQHSPSPFFDPSTGAPRVQPDILSSSERESLRKHCGPKP